MIMGRKGHCVHTVFAVFISDCLSSASLSFLFIKENGLEEGVGKLAPAVWIQVFSAWLRKERYTSNSSQKDKVAAV